MTQKQSSQGNNAQYAFFYFLSLVALILTAISVGSIIFQIINKYIIDAVFDYSRRFDVNAVKFGVSAIIIASPVYYITISKIQKALWRGDLDNRAGVRRWLSYFILFIATVIIIGYLIGILFSFFDGELTTKFILKALTAIGISGGIFGYYLYDIKRDKVVQVKDKVVTIFFWSSLIIVLVSLISAFVFVFESPAVTRERRLDDETINRLQRIESAVNNYQETHEQLPENLTILIESDFLTDSELEDMITKEYYSYKIINKKEFELCANFYQNSEDDPSQPRYPVTKYDWSYEAGEDCFTRAVWNYKKDVEPEPVPMMK